MVPRCVLKAPRPLLLSELLLSSVARKRSPAARHQRDKRKLNYFSRSCLCASPLFLTPHSLFKYVDLVFNTLKYSRLFFCSLPGTWPHSCNKNNWNRKCVPDSYKALFFLHGLILRKQQVVQMYFFISVIFTSSSMCLWIQGRYFDCLWNILL